MESILELLKDIALRGFVVEQTKERLVAKIDNVEYKISIQCDFKLANPKFEICVSVNGIYIGGHSTTFVDNDEAKKFDDAWANVRIFWYDRKDEIRDELKAKFWKY